MKIDNVVKAVNRLAELHDHYPEIYASFNESELLDLAQSMSEFIDDDVKCNAYVLKHMRNDCILRFRVNQAAVNIIENYGAAHGITRSQYLRKLVSEHAASLAQIQKN